MHKQSVNINQILIHVNALHNVVADQSRIYEIVNK